MNPYAKQVRTVAREALSRGSQMVIDEITSGDILLCDITGLSAILVAAHIESVLGFRCDEAIIAVNETVADFEAAILESAIEFDVKDDLDQACPEHVCVHTLPENTLLKDTKMGLDPDHACALLENRFKTTITKQNLEVLTIVGAISFIKVMVVCVSEGEVAQAKG